MSVQHKLLNWFLIHQRNLPFRKNHEAYRIWVSEIMLQQTQVDTVIPYYNRFMKRFPTVFDLAKATEDEVYKLWEGLGYYSRARNLLKCAKVIALEYNGEFPKDHKPALKLPGVGPYTAGAVLSIAYNLKHPAVDGNVMRVMSRIYDMDEDTAIPKVRKVFEEKVMSIMPDDARNFNQALMELGALICTPKSPKCEKCPVKDECKGFALDNWNLRPVKTKKIKNKKVSLSVGIVYRDHKVLLIKNEKGLLSGLWGFPAVEGKDEEETRNGLLALMRDEYCYNVNSLEELGTAKHVFTHKTWEMKVYRVEQEIGDSEIVGRKIGVREDESVYGQETVWTSVDGIEDYAVSTAFKKVMKLL